MTRENAQHLIGSSSKSLEGSSSAGNLGVACTSQHPPSPFTHRSMWSPPDKTTFTMLSALKLNSFLSQPRVYILVFPLGRCVFQTGTSESSGDRNTLHCETFKKYYRGTLGAQGRKATSPSNSLALMLGCPQSHLSTHWAWARSRTHGDLAALTQDLTTLTLAPTKAFIAQAQAQARGVSQAEG